ncbi:MAG: hypothetical protein LBK99_08520 [Opitutaceae bacterium]|jgi:hypothetical protein|nr:hypothetical protein [Opitutaceae bacterium]
MNMKKTNDQKKTNYAPPFRRALSVLALAAAALLALPSVLSAASDESYYYVGPDNGDWNEAANWSTTPGGDGGAGVPATDPIHTREAYVDTGATVIASGTLPSIHSLSIGGNSEVVLNSNLTLGSGYGGGLDRGGHADDQWRRAGLRRNVGSWRVRVSEPQQRRPHHEYHT